MIITLAFILFILMILIDSDRGAKSFLTLIFNMVALICTILLISKGYNSLVVTFFTCMFISVITLFYQNGVNVKTKTAFISVIVTTLVLLVFVYFMASKSIIQGIPIEQQFEGEMIAYSKNINLNMTDIEISIIIIGLIGAILDTAVAVATSTYEVYINNTHLNKKELFKSSMNMGKDILGTTMNTLFFSYISEFMTLMIYFNKNKYSFSKIINSKVFAQEFIRILFSGIGCVIIILTTAIITSNIIMKIKKVKNKAVT